MSSVHLFKIGLFEKMGFSKSAVWNWAFEKTECLVKTVKKCFLKKLSVWVALMKVEVWVINYQKGQDIYIKRSVTV